MNIIDQTKDNFIKSLSVKGILDEIEISKNDYFRILSITKDEDLELHLKKPNFYFSNNYFDVGLQAWQANVDIQTVLSECKAVTCMYQFFKKIQDQCS